MICNYSLQDTSLDPGAAADPAGATLGGEDGDTMSSEALYLRIWLARKVSVLVCVGISSCFAFTFIDYNKANHRLLEDIRQQGGNSIGLLRLEFWIEKWLETPI